MLHNNYLYTNLKNRVAHINVGVTLHSCSFLLWFYPIMVLVKYIFEITNKDFFSVSQHLVSFPRCCYANFILYDTTYSHRLK